jgi:uncharacterized protein (DUF2252 family)
MTATARRTRVRDAGPARRGDRAAEGKAARAWAPLEAHADPGPESPRDPVGLVLGQARTRVPELVPLRHERMLVSPFTFFRGAALPMAADLSGTPTSGLRVQLCGDAHLLNFGAYASPERRLVFDVNDFDETLPGPFEWDVKRLAASLAVAGRDNGFSGKARRRIVLGAVAAYRTAMRDFARQPRLEVWYTHLAIEETIARYRSQLRPGRYRATTAALAKAHRRDSLQALDSLTAVVDGQRRFVSAPPALVPVEELVDDVATTDLYDLIGAVLARYRRSLQSDRRHLLDGFHLVQMARKVVGVGSVGTRAWVLLLDDGTGSPLLLQAKEAQPSVLAGYCGASRYRNEGERVVVGQHLMQAHSDIFLGWTRISREDGERDFYVRQLRDWKLSARVDRMLTSGMRVYAALCGWTLARAHARSGDRVALAAYLGGSARFDNAVADFAEAYADRNERDYAAFRAAVTGGAHGAR